MPKKPIAERPPNPEKIKDMIESILPCKRASCPNVRIWLRIERRRVRHIANQNLRTCDSEGYTDKDLKPKYRQSGNVSMRRGRDKVEPLLRWANRRTQAMDYDESLGYIRRMLPRNLIGDHAFSHWEFEVKRRFNRPYYR